MLLAFLGFSFSLRPQEFGSLPSDQSGTSGPIFVRRWWWRGRQPTNMVHFFIPCRSYRPKSPIGWGLTGMTRLEFSRARESIAISSPQTNLRLSCGNSALNSPLKKNRQHRGTRNRYESPYGSFGIIVSVPLGLLCSAANLQVHSRLSDSDRVQSKYFPLHGLKEALYCVVHSDCLIYPRLVMDS